MPDLNIPLSFVSIIDSATDQTDPDAPPKDYFKEIVEAIIDHVWQDEVFRPWQVSLYLWHPVQRTLILSATRTEGVDELQFSDEEPDYNPEIPRKANYQMQRVFNLNSPQEADWANNWTRRHGIVAYCVANIEDEDNRHLNGTLFLNYREPRTPDQFGDDYRDRLNRFRNGAQFVLKYLWYRRHSRIIDNFGNRLNLNPAETPGELFKRVYAVLRQLIDTRGGDVVLADLNPSGREMTVYAYRAQLEQQPGTRPYSKLVDELINQMTQAKDATNSAQAEYGVYYQDYPSLSPTDETYIPLESLMDESERREHSTYYFLPIVFNKTILSLLGISHPDANAFSKQDRSLLRQIRAHLAGAMRNQRLYRNFNHMRTFLADGEIGSQDATRLDSIAAWICKSTEAKIVEIYEYNPESGSFDLPPHISGERQSPITEQGPKPGGIAHLVLERNEPLFIRSDELVSYLGATPNDYSEREQVMSTAALPLRLNNQSQGVMFINYAFLHPFDNPTKLLIGAMASVAAMAITMNRANVEKDEGDELINRFVEIGQILSAVRDMTDLEDRLPLVAHQLLLLDAELPEMQDAPQERLILRFRELESLRLAYSYPNDLNVVDMLTDQNAYSYGILYASEPRYLGALPFSQGIAEEFGPGTQSVLIMQITGGNRPLGTLAIASTQSEMRYGEPVMRQFVQNVAIMLGLVLRMLSIGQEVTSQQRNLLEAHVVAQLARQHVWFGNRLADKIGAVRAVYPNSIRKRLQESNLPPDVMTEIEDLLDKIAESIDSGIRLTDELKNRIDTDLNEQVHHSWVEIPANTLIKTVAQEMRLDVRARSQQVGIDFAEDTTNAKVLIQQEAARRAIRAVIDNALEAMPGGGQLGIGIVADDTLGTVSIYVDDTSSVGLPRDIDPFAMGATANPDARGFGLWEARFIVKQFGGTIYAQSKADHGTEMIIELPTAERARQLFQP